MTAVDLPIPPAEGERIGVRGRGDERRPGRLVPRRCCRGRRMGTLEVVWRRLNGVLVANCSPVVLVWFSCGPLVVL